MEAEGDEGGVEGEGGEVGLEVGEAGGGDGGVGELEGGGLLEVLGEADAEEAEEGLAAVCAVWGEAEGGVPWEGGDVAQIYGA